MHDTRDGALPLDDMPQSQAGAVPLPWRSSSRLAVEQLSFATTDGALALAEESPAPQAQPVVLIAESDPALATAVRDELCAQMGRHVVIAGNGRHALDLIMRTRPRVVLLDVELSGVDLSAHLRMRLTASKAHVIFVTTATSHELYRLGVREGVLLRKPYDPHDLAGIIRTLLDA